MARPRIMIADTDVNYILPLQLKFIEDFFEKIDLEIITEETCFEEVFAVPQKVDILIVSEDFYDLSLQRHNITHVFLMTEQYEEERTADLNVNRIFKYSSIKEIFNEILGKSAETLNIENNSIKEPQIVAVTSASGGVGKTTVAMALSACLTRNYKKVLYINTDQLHTFQYLLQNPSPIADNVSYAKMIQGNGNVYNEIKHVIRNELFSYLPPFKAALMSLGIPYDVYLQIVESAKGSKEFDFIIVDTDSVFDENKARILDLADKVIFVTRQTRASVLATNALVSNINGIKGEKYAFICNDFDKDVDNALISPNYVLKFGINEYIEHVRNYDQMKCTDFAEQTSFQKAAYLLI